MLAGVLRGLGFFILAPIQYPYAALGSKKIRTSEAAPVKSGDRQPVQQTLVVP
jgi:hypothetical protein